MRKNSAIVLMIMFATFAAIAGKCGIADLYSLRPDGAMDERPVKKIPDAELAQSFDSASFAHGLDPGNPLYLENMAKIRYWQAEASSDGAKKKLFFEESLRYATEASRLAPVSPHAWSSRMLAAMKLGKYEYDGDMENATMLGPWEPEIQVDVAKAGMASWQVLSAKGKKVVMDDFSRGYRMQSGKMTEIALNCGKHGKNCD